jgi:hypothetical protein
LLISSDHPSLVEKVEFDYVVVENDYKFFVCVGGAELVLVDVLEVVVRNTGHIRNPKPSERSSVLCSWVLQLTEACLLNFNTAALLERRQVQNA